MATIGTNTKFSEITIQLDRVIETKTKKIEFMHNYASIHNNNEITIPNNFIILYCRVAIDLHYS